ncbi:MAG TPA: GAF domain-containing protein [Candidatus Binatia bacterium]
MCEDVQNDPLFAPWKEMASARGIGSLVAVPLLVRGESHGAIIIYASRPRAYSEETIALLTSLAAQGAAALENARLFGEAEQRAKEQAALGAIATATNQSLDLDRVLRVSLEKVKEITGREVAYIRLIDPVTNRLRVAAHEGLSEEAVNKLNRSRIGGKGEKVLAGGEPVVINDSQGNLLSDVTRGQGRVSVAWFPLKVQGETVGILNVATSRLMPFSGGEVRLLQAISNVIGVTIGNAKLYEETRQSFQRIHALHELEAAVSSSLDLNSVLNVLLEKIDVLFDYGAATVRLYNPETRMLEPLASRNIDWERWQTAMRTAPAGLAKDVFETGRPLKLIDVCSDPRARDQEFFTREGVVSYLGLPLIAKGEKIGVIGFYTKQEHDFSAQEIEFLQTIASHAAIAIKNAKLYEESERRAGEQEALSSVAMATNQSLDIKEVIGIALDKVVEITGRERAYIRLQNAATGNMELIAHRGLTAAHAELIMKGRFDGKSARVFATGEPLILNDPDRARRKTDSGAARNAVSARIPLKAGGKTIGILNVGSSQPQPFLSREVRLLQALANVIGVAVENARLYAETQRNLARVRALHEIDSAILSSANHETVLKVLLEKIDLFIPYASATIRMWNRETQALEPVVCQKFDEGQWKIEAPGAGWGPASATFESKATLTIKDCRTDPRVYGPEFFRKHRLVSYLGVPLIAKDNVLGVISFYTNEEHEFTAEEIEFVETLAGQAAVAIEHSLLYRDLIKREAQLQLTHKQLEALHSVTVQAGQSLDLDTVTQSVIDKITEIFDFDATRFYFYNEKMDELSVKGQYEKNPEVFSGVKSFARGQGNVGRVAESGEPLIFEDVSTDPVYRKTSSTQTSRKGGFKFYAALPIKGSRQILGTMVCMGVAPRRLNDAEFQLLTAMVGRVAVAVENASLYEEIKKRAEELHKKTVELETANRVKGEFLSVMSHELRTPLSVVMGYAGMLKEGMLGELNKQQTEAVEKMLSRAGDQLNIINDIMQTTQLEARSAVIERHEIDAAKLVRDLASLYGKRLGDKDVAIRWDYPPEILPVLTDGAKVRQILQNIISNACKFTEKGTIAVSTRRAGEMVEFVVADTGIGIPQDMQSMIFEKFRQVDSSETRSYGGVGLGLYIAKQFTELLGGEITVESEVGKGSKFIVRIPAGCNSARPATGEKRQARSGGAEGETASLRTEQ